MCKCSLRKVLRLHVQDRREGGHGRQRQVPQVGTVCTDHPHVHLGELFHHELGQILPGGLDDGTEALQECEAVVVHVVADVEVGELLEGHESVEVVVGEAGARQGDRVQVGAGVDGEVEGGGVQVGFGT